ncbi:CHAT domain-containing protein [Nodularia chucula]|uniref:CHAT domain-containing protein n=1 Tax=Nodularia chucula TaxID=3093667 RepID=UPI0039C60175
MESLAVLLFESGDFEQGFIVKLQLQQAQGYITATLPKNPQISSVYANIQNLYYQVNPLKRKQNIDHQYHTRKRKYNVQNSKDKKDPKQEIREYIELLQGQLNEWLNSKSFQVIRTAIINNFSAYPHSRLVIQANNPLLWRLPWHNWDILQRLGDVEVTLSFPQLKPIQKFSPASLRNGIRILTVIGATEGIDVTGDINAIYDIFTQKQAEIKIVPQLAQTQLDIQISAKSTLSRRELYDVLWDYQPNQDVFIKTSSSQINNNSFLTPQGWDILVFAGHSNTLWSKDQTGVLHINSEESLSIGELRSAIKSALAFGLKLVIFNSCDGLGLAKDLMDLQIPYVIVMREEVPNNVAVNFIRTFLQEFVQNREPIHTAVSKARRQLNKLEAQYPLASWLPIIFQSSPILNLTWEQLLTGLKVNSDWRGCCLTLFTLDALRRLQNNLLTKIKGLEIEDIYIAPKLRLLQTIQPNNWQEVRQLSDDHKIPKNYEFIEFLEKVITRSNIGEVRRLAILGEPGSGKTLLLQRAGDWIYWNLNRLVIWVYLANVNRTQSLENYLQTVWLKRAQAEGKLSWANQENLSEIFASKNVWLLLDGVDEMNVNSGDPVGEVTRQINQSNFLSQANIILTCRLHLWEANKYLLQQFEIFQNLNFTAGDNPNMFSTEVNQVTLFIRRWFTGNSQKGEALITEIRQDRNKRIEDLSSNPLILSLLCLVWETNQDKTISQILTSRAALYERFVEDFYKWKAELFRQEDNILVKTNERLTLNQSTIDQLNHDLGILAKRCFEDKQNRKVTSAQLEQVTANPHPATKFFLPAIKNIIANSGMELYTSPFHISHFMASLILKTNLKLALQLGWLNQVGTSKYDSNQPIYAFFHPTFHQYFAAKAINEGEYEFFLKHSIILPPPYGNYRVFDSQWQEVMLLWFGREDVLDDFKQLLIENLWRFRDDSQFFYTYKARFLAVAALAEFKPCRPLERQLTDDYHHTTVTVNEMIDLVGKTSFIYKSNEDENDWSLPFKAFENRAKIAFTRTNPELSEKWLVNFIRRNQPECRIVPALTLNYLSPAHPLVIDALLEHFKMRHQEDNKLHRIYSTKFVIHIAKNNEKAINQFIDFFNYAEDEDIEINVALVLGCIANSNHRMPNLTKSVVIEAIDRLIQCWKNTPSTESRIYSCFHEYCQCLVDENPNIAEYLINQLVQLSQNLLLEENQNNNFSKNPRYRQYLIAAKQVSLAIALLTISPVNQLAMNTLIKVAVQEPENEIDVAIFQCWKNLGKDYPVIIHSLCAYIHKLDEEKATSRFFFKTIDILGDVALGDLVAIEVLSHRLKIAESSDLRLSITKQLIKIDPVNIKAINHLRELMETDTCVDRRASAAKYLGEFSELYREVAINTLISWQNAYFEEVMDFVEKSSIDQDNITRCIAKLARESEEEYGKYAEKTIYLQRLFRQSALISNIADSLSNFSRNHPQVIAHLTELILKFPRCYTQYCLVQNLGRIDPGNPVCIEMWMQLYDYETKADERQSIATQFRSTVYYNWNAEVGDRTRRQMIIDALTKILKSTEDTSFKLGLAETLGLFDPGNALAISTLISLVKGKYNGHFSHPTAALEKMLQGEKAEIVAREVVIHLKDLLKDTYKNRWENDNYDRLQYLLELYYLCSEILPYPEFYRIFNNKSKTYHLKPRFVIFSIFKSVANLGFDITYDILHPVDLLIKISASIGRILQGLFWTVGVILTSVVTLIIVVIYPIYWLSKKYLKIDLKRTLMRALGGLYGLTVGGIILITTFTVILLSLSLGLAVVPLPVMIVLILISAGVIKFTGNNE